MNPGQQIAAEVAQAYGLTLEDIRGPSRSRVVCAARAQAMRAISERLGYSHSRIARLFGRDTSTVWHHLRKADECAEVH